MSLSETDRKEDIQPLIEPAEKFIAEIERLIYNSSF